MFAKLKRLGLLFPLALVMAADDSQCGGESQSDKNQRVQQESLSQEATAQTGMPAIKNFRERKLLKDILELRDQDGLATYTYVWNEFNGKLIFFCNSVGYGIPYATQYSNPQKIMFPGYSQSGTISQSEPNGLFSPQAAEGTWVMCADPANKDGTKPVYVEPRIIVSPFRLAQ